MGLVAGNPEVLGRVPIGHQQDIRTGRTNKLAQKRFVAGVGRASKAAGHLETGRMGREHCRCLLRDAGRGPEQKQPPTPRCRHFRHPSGEGHAGGSSAQRGAKPPGRQQQPKPIGDGKGGPVQHLPKGGISLRLHHKLRVDRNDLVGGGLLSPFRDEALDALKGFIFGHVVDRHAKNGDTG